MLETTNPLLYTNRAMARLKLKLYEAVIPDCEASLELLQANMKAYYYMAQAELELGRKIAALKNAEIAYELCSGVKVGSRVGALPSAGYDKTWERSLGSVTALVLRCKKEVWEMKEKERLRGRNSLLLELVEDLERRRDLEIDGIEGGEIERQEMLKEVTEIYSGKIEELKGVWEAAAGAEGKRREVPDWLIDDITFAVMHDPVMVSDSSSG
jgi:STIP1 family protein 1